MSKSLDDLYATIMDQVDDIRNKKQLFGRAKETGEVVENLRKFVKLHREMKLAEKAGALPSAMLPEGVKPTLIEGKKK